MRKKKILILTDLGHKYGMGHFSRSSALVEAFLIDKNWTAEFYLNADLNLNLPKKPQRLYKKSNWLKQAPVAFCDLLIIDSYNTDQNFINKLTQKYAKTPWIILENFQGLNYTKNSLIHNATYIPQELNSNKKMQEATNKTLVSQEFILLRREFWHQPKKTTGALKEILIIFGGSDLRELSLPVTKMLLENFVYLNLKVVLGDFAKNSLKQDLLNLQKLHTNKLEVKIAPSGKKLAKIMSAADLAISAAGQTMLELIASGLPTIGVEIVDNQANVNQELAELKVIYAGGDYQDTKLIDKLKNLVQLMHSEEVRAKMSYRQQNLIDGKGAINSRDFILNHFNL